MDVSPEDMDMSIASSHNDIHMHPAQYSSRRRQLANFGTQYCEPNDKRLVRIRNPQYITPHTSRRQVNHVHQFDENYEYHVATSPSLRFNTGNQSSVSATPRRGPWRYMEVNNQWNPPDSHPHFNDRKMTLITMEYRELCLGKV